MRLFLEYDADPNIIMRSRSPLILCADLYAVDIGRLLLEYGADPNYRHPYFNNLHITHERKDGTTALISACINKRWYFIDLLLEYQANPNLRDRWGRTALAILIQYLVMEIEKEKLKTYVIALLKNGADPNVGLCFLPGALIAR